MSASLTTKERKNKVAAVHYELALSLADLLTRHPEAVQQVTMPGEEWSFHDQLHRGEFYRAAASLGAYLHDNPKLFPRG